MSFACAICHAPVAERQPRCEQCQVALDWAAGRPVASHPFIKPGDPLYFTDLTRAFLPGREVGAGTLTDGTRFEATPQGSLVTVVPTRAFEAYEPRLRSRDQCVRAAFVALDRGVTVSCLGRIDPIGTAKLKYVFEVDPASRRYCIERGFSSPETAQFATLVGWQAHPAIAGLGQINVVELRLQGPTIEARINDQHVVTLHDAALGIGAAGVRLSAATDLATPARALVQWFEMRQVMA